MSSISIIKTLEDKCYVMSIVCGDCSRYFNKIKNILLIPLILVSSFLVVANGNADDANEWIKYVNMALNGMNIVLMGIQSKLEVVEKTHMFNELSKKYSQLYNDICNKQMLEEVDAVYLHEITMKYDNLQNSDISIPNKIRKRVIDKYKNKRVLPNCLMSSADRNDSPTNSVNLVNANV